LSGTATWDNQTIAGLTLIPGSYTWSWGSDGTADSFTVNIVGAAVTPEPSAFILGGLGLVGLLVAARRRKA
jgi:MYXO-CTERM domain-containing protein